MEDQHTSLIEPEHLGSKKTIFRPQEHPAEQVGPFSESAKALSTNSQEPKKEFDGHQVDRNITPIQSLDKDGTHNIAVTRGINRSPAPSTSGQSIAQELPLSFQRDILDVHDTEATGRDNYFLEKRELKSLAERRESTQIFNRDGLDTETVRGGNTYGAKTTDDEKYFQTESELQFHSFSDQGGKGHIKKAKETQASVSSSINKYKRVFGPQVFEYRETKQKHTNSEESVELDDDCWKRSLKNDDNTSEKSSFEQGLTEPQCQGISSPPRRRFNPKPTRALDHSSIVKSRSGAKLLRTTAGESTEVEVKYCRRSYLNNVITSKQSSLERVEPEPEHIRQWYRSQIRSADFQSPRNTLEKCRLILVMLIMFILCVAFFVSFILICIYIFNSPY